MIRHLLIIKKPSKYEDISQKISSLHNLKPQTFSMYVIKLMALQKSRET